MSDHEGRGAASVSASHEAILTPATEGTQSPQITVSSRKRGGWPKGKPRGRAFGKKVSQSLKARADRIREGKATAAPTESEVA